MVIGIETAIFGKDRDRDLHVGDRAHALNWLVLLGYLIRKPCTYFERVLLPNRETVTRDWVIGDD